ncbi:malate synthase [Crossiella equi]|uniref:Malate synthase n=1 Tax=Crossiella equi TaxID=130796 RepID=A0ABS5AI08_9PSEU|nr:malate synthase A [Crossiella equi]MBP2476206.1 malate synthase [Crossiella equi]
MSQIRVVGRSVDRGEEILTPAALEFVAGLHQAFGARRKELLARRAERRAAAAQDHGLDFLPETREIRESEWRVAEAPADLRDRRVEITGPTERKMAINALNSGAKVWLADLEDANTPHWENVVAGQVNLADAVRKRIELTTPEGKRYALKPDVEHAVILVRPRGWHLDERHLLVDDEPVAGALVDFGLHFFHNAAELLARGSGPYFYLPKMESHLEARLWNDVFTQAQAELGIPLGSVRATVLIETIPAAFEMDEILYELRDHASGLNAGRWDYLFSIIKTFRDAGPDFVLPDRNSVTMTAPFMRAYTELLVRTCHRRGAFAMGGMAAFIPNRRDPEVTETALAKVREDKTREATDGFDGSWVAHPDLVPVCREVFDGVLGEQPNQLGRLREDVQVKPEQLLDVASARGAATMAGLRSAVDVGVRYIASWLAGNGAAAIHNLMEDAATAEISRSQVWQWIYNDVGLDTGEPVTADLVRRVLAETVAHLRGEQLAELDAAAQLFEQVTLGKDYPDFLTLPAYERIL